MQRKKKKIIIIAATTKIYNKRTKEEKRRRKNCSADLHDPVRVGGLRREEDWVVRPHVHPKAKIGVLRVSRHIVARVRVLVRVREGRLDKVDHLITVHCQSGDHRVMLGIKVLQLVLVDGLLLLLLVRGERGGLFHFHRLVLRHNWRGGGGDCLLLLLRLLGSILLHDLVTQGDQLSCLEEERAPGELLGILGSDLLLAAVHPAHKLAEDVVREVGDFKCDILGGSLEELGEILAP